MGRWCWVSANSGLYWANGYKQSAKKAAMTFDDVMGLSYVVAGCWLLYFTDLKGTLRLWN